jgi:O-antigen ligase
MWSVRQHAADAARSFQLRKLGLNKISESNSLVLGMLAAAWQWRVTRPTARGMRRALAAAYLIQLWALLSYQQRGPQVAFLCSMAAMALLLYEGTWRMLRRGRYRDLAIAAAGVLLLLGVLLYALNPSFDLTKLLQDRNVLVRFRLYRQALAAFLSRPFVGVGAGGIAMFATDEQSRLYPHNMVLEVVAETGLVGLALFTAFTVSLGHRLALAVRCLDFRSWLPVCFLGAALLSQYVLVMFSIDLTLWQMGVWAGMVVAAVQIHPAQETAKAGS